MNNTKGYRESFAHITEHKDFVKKVSEFQKGFNEGKVLLSLDVMNFLKDWLVSHINLSDKKFGEFYGKLNS